MALVWIGLAASNYFTDLLEQTRDGLSNGLGRPFGDDFVNYWSGAFLALHGRAAEVYDFAAFHAFEQSVTALSLKYYHYSYPPVLLLLTLPLAFIPYVPALFIWLAATWYAFYRALRLTGHAGVLLLSIATPALFVNAIGGQNGAITAALLGGGLMLVDRRPVDCRDPVRHDDLQATPRRHAAICIARGTALAGGVRDGRYRCVAGGDQRCLLRRRCLAPVPAQRLLCFAL